MAWMQNKCYNHVNKNADYKMVDYFFHFQHPFTSVISGPTMSGKTVFISKLIDLSEKLIKPAICEIHDDYKENKPILIIIDDLMTESNNKLGNFFYKRCTP